MRKGADTDKQRNWVGASDRSKTPGNTERTAAPAGKPTRADTLAGAGDTSAGALSREDGSRIT